MCNLSLYFKERGIEEGIAKERERSEKLLAEKEQMIAEKEAQIESLKKQLKTMIANPA